MLCLTFYVLKNIQKKHSSVCFNDPAAELNCIYVHVVSASYLREGNSVTQTDLTWISACL